MQANLTKQRRWAGKGSIRAGTTLLAAALCLVTVGATTVRQDPARVEDARASLEQWVETRGLISKERNDWAVAKEMLTNRVAVVQAAIDSMRQTIAEAETQITEVDDKRAELVQEEDALKQTSAELESVVTELEGRVKALLPRLPDPLRQRVKVLSQRIPEDPESTEQSLGQRYESVVGVLNFVNKFNREITVTSEMRTLGNGSRAEVTALYLGLGQAFYVSADGKAAGVGRPTAEGWDWQPADESAEAIARAVSVWKNEVGAEFVPVPVRID